MALDKHQAADAVIRQKYQLDRSPAWPQVEKAFRTAHPQCAACSETGQLNAHHKFPFHYVVQCGRPDLELDPRNLVTLCVRQDREHHILLGHLDDYESYNPDVADFVYLYHDETNQQIRADAAWQQAHLAKPKRLEQMTPDDKVAFKKMLDQKFLPDPAIVAKAAAARKVLPVNISASKGVGL